MEYSDNMTINVIDNENYKKLTKFLIFLENNGFRNVANKKSLGLYMSIDNYLASAIIISVRIDNDVQRFEDLTKKSLEQIRNNNKFDETTGKESVNALYELITDLKSFYLFMRGLLDIITKILKELTENQNLPYSFHALVENFETYSKINPNFFGKTFQEKIIKFDKFIEERDGIIHKLHSFFFTNDVSGSFGFDIRKSIDQKTGTSYVIPIKKFTDDKISEYLEILDYMIDNPFKMQEEKC